MYACCCSTAGLIIREEHENPRAATAEQRVEERKERWPIWPTGFRGWSIFYRSPLRVLNSFYRTGN